MGDQALETMTHTYRSLRVGAPTGAVYGGHVLYHLSKHFPQVPALSVDYSDRRPPANLLLFDDLEEAGDEDILVLDWVDTA